MLVVIETKPCRLLPDNPLTMCSNNFVHAMKKIFIFVLSWRSKMADEIQLRKSEFAAQLATKDRGRERGGWIGSGKVRTRGGREELMTQTTGWIGNISKKKRIIKCNSKLLYLWQLWVIFDFRKPLFSYLRIARKLMYSVLMYQEPLDTIWRKFYS